MSKIPTTGRNTLVADVRTIVGDDHVLVDGDLCAGYASDWTGRFVGRTPAVVRPADVDQVAEVLRYCSGRQVAVVPQGGNTGMVGGSVPLHGELVLSLTRLTRLDDVDRPAAQVTVGAGVTLSMLQRHATAAGFAFGVDLGARDTATVGGMVATNAGGIRFLRYGGMRDQIAGLEAVLADGSVLSHLDGLAKDNTGYDWARLLCGSEGTLAVVTAVRATLVPADPERALALLAFDATPPAIDAVWALRDAVRSLSAVELFLHDGLELVTEQLGLPRPFRANHQAYVLVECSGVADPLEELADAVDSLGSVADVAVADPARHEQLWSYRERHTEAIGMIDTPHKLDVTIPARSIARFIEQVPGVVEQAHPGARTWLFGHIADGNIHVNITGVPADDEGVEDAVLRYVAGLGGSISAEHGIGAAKRRWLHLNRSAAEIDVFRRVKSSLDPAGILNPHVLLPEPTDAGTGSNDAQ